MPTGIKMADIKTPEERSKNMSKIRSKDTKPEVWLRKQLFQRGYRYRKNVRYIFGCPDIWLSRYHTAVFVHGCFWHRHLGCKYAYMPKSRTEFWEKKFAANRERDQNVKKELETARIKVLIVWECTIKRMVKSQTLMNEYMNAIEAFLASNDMYIEL